MAEAGGHDLLLMAAARPAARSRDGAGTSELVLLVLCGTNCAGVLLVTRFNDYFCLSPRMAQGVNDCKPDCLSPPTTLMQAISLRAVPPFASAALPSAISIFLAGSYPKLLRLQISTRKHSHCHFSQSLRPKFVYRQPVNPPATHAITESAHQTSSFTVALNTM
jgi:hypothetical protein